MSRTFASYFHTYTNCKICVTAPHISVASTATTMASSNGTKQGSSSQQLVTTESTSSTAGPDSIKRLVAITLKEQALGAVLHLNPTPVSNRSMDLPGYLPIVLYQDSTGITGNHRQRIQPLLFHCGLLKSHRKKVASVNHRYTGDSLGTHE